MDHAPRSAQPEPPPRVAANLPPTGILVLAAKVRIGTECPDDRHDVAERLAPAVKSEVAQVLGRTLLLWRKRPKDSKIQLPKDA